MALAPIFQNRLRLPVVAAPMFLVTGPDLVVACCSAGISCAIPALNHRTSEGFADWLKDISDRLAKAEDASGKPAAPFGVNLIVHRSNSRLQEDLRQIVAAQVPFVVTSLGAVPDIVHAVHSYGGIVLHDVTTVRHAEKAIGAGADGVIGVAAGAGGHAGTTNPFALVSELKPIVGDKMLILAGSLSTGADIAGAIAAGADLAYMGTRFIATKESLAAAEYKDMIERAASKDIVYTPKVSGVNANFLAESLEKAGVDFSSGEDAPTMNLKEEAKAWATIWSAGHGVGAIDSVPAVKDLVDELALDFTEARKRLDGWPSQG